MIHFQMNSSLKNQTHGIKKKTIKKNTFFSSISKTIENNSEKKKQEEEIRNCVRVQKHKSWGVCVVLSVFRVYSHRCWILFHISRVFWSCKEIYKFFCDLKELNVHVLGCVYMLCVSWICEICGKTQKNSDNWKKNCTVTCLLT